MSSNYPPGVTGSEPEIIGEPELEQSALIEKVDRENDYRARAIELFRTAQVEQLKRDLEDVRRADAAFRADASAELSKVLELDVPEDGWLTSVGDPTGDFGPTGEATIELDGLKWVYRSPWLEPPISLPRAVGVVLGCPEDGLDVTIRIAFLVDLGQLLEDGVIHARDHAPQVAAQERQAERLAAAKRTPTADELLIESVRAVARDEVRRHAEYE